MSYPPLPAADSFFTPAARAVSQLGDPVFIGVALRSVAWAALAFAALAAGLVWEGQALLGGHGWLAWLAGVAGGIGAAVLSMFLFLPLASVIASLFIERIADAVERRWYPGLAPARAAPVVEQLIDGLALGLRVLAMQLLALALGLILPGIGIFLGWLVAAWAIGRGLFVAVAMRRMDRAAALRAYRKRRFAVIVQGGFAVTMSLIPLLNLFIPLLGTAALVHVLHAPRRD